jgi:integrase
MIQVHFVEQTLPYLLPCAADMVRLQLLSGARPGEICSMRACDIDMTGKVWLYKPAQHKTAHHGYERVIAIGPRGQAIIKPRLKANTDAFIFSPQDAMQEKWQRDRQERKTKVYPCERERRGPRKVTGCYAPTTYCIAIRRAIQRANQEREQQGQPLLPHWSPNRLRHTKGTLIRRQAGLDAARAVLGHRSPVVTEIYSELDMSQAVALAEKLG